MFLNIRTLRKLYIAFHLFFLNKVVYHYWLFSVHSVFMSFIYIYSLNCESTKLYIEITQTRMHEQIFTEDQLDNVICFCFFKENSFIFFFNKFGQFVFLHVNAQNDIYTLYIYRKKNMSRASSLYEPN